MKALFLSTSSSPPSCTKLRSVTAMLARESLRLEAGQVCPPAVHLLNEQPISQNMSKSYRAISFCRIHWKNKEAQLICPSPVSGQPVSQVSTLNLEGGLGWSSPIWVSVGDFAQTVEFRGLGSNWLIILCFVCSRGRKEMLNYTHLKLLANE